MYGQGCGSGSALIWVSGSGSRSKCAKITHKRMQTIFVWWQFLHKTCIFTEYLAQFSNNKNLCKILLFQGQKQHYFLESWPLIFYFLTFFIPFYVGPGSKSGSGTVRHSRSGSGSTTLLIPRNPRCKHESPEKQTLGIEIWLFSISGLLLQSWQIIGFSNQVSDYRL